MMPRWTPCFVRLISRMSLSTEQLSAPRLRSKITYRSVHCNRGCVYGVSLSMQSNQPGDSEIQSHHPYVHPETTTVKTPSRRTCGSCTQMETSSGSTISPFIRFLLSSQETVRRSETRSVNRGGARESERAKWSAWERGHARCGCWGDCWLSYVCLTS